jgi:cbb3-type cytochrome oxidase subunit 3
MYILSGLALVIAFIVVIVYYYTPKRKGDVEAAKYAMLNDYDEPIQDDPETDSDSSK